ncbi:MAG: RNA polymerase sporulation sigma factor SigG [Clostridia bacterium]
MLINKVEICGVNTSQLPIINNEEKIRLLKKIKEGDKEAREEFISGNLRLVLSVIQRFNHRGANADDLFQVGCIGLIKAMDNFDLSQNVQFSTYAVPMIIGEIRRYLRDNNPIRVSRSIRDLAYKALQAKEKLTKDSGKEPTIEAIAKEIGVPREEVVFSLDAIQDPISLQEPVYNDGQDSIYVMDQVKDKKNTDELWAESITIAEAMKKLNDREKMIMNKRFFDGRTQMEVAEEIGISQAQVSRLEKSAISHIRKWYD